MKKPSEPNVKHCETPNAKNIFVRFFLFLIYIHFSNIAFQGKYKIKQTFLDVWFSLIIIYQTLAIASIWHSS